MHLWDLKAGLYHPLRRLPLVRKILDQELVNLRVLLEEGDVRPERIVDIGTGSGSTRALFPERALVVGVDRSGAMLHRARKRIPGLIPIMADALFLPVKSNGTAFVSAIGIAEYIRNKNDLLKETKRVLAPGGWFLITLPRFNALNLCRNLLGSPLFMIRRTQWKSLLHEHGLDVLGVKKSLLQIQYLCRLTANP